MSPHAYTEDQLVEQPAIDELARDRSAMSLEAANREIYIGFGGIKAGKLEFISLSTRDLLLPRLLSGQIDVEALDHV
jgi:hypothetical protein